MRKKAELTAAHEAVTAATRALDDKLAELQVADDMVRAAEAHRDEIRAGEAALRQKLAEREAEKGKVEDAAVVQLSIDLAGEIIKRQSQDPVRYAAWILRQGKRLQEMVRGPFDMPISEEYVQHPAITQALGLIPPQNPLDTPVYLLGGVAPSTAWPVRRRAILAHAYPA